MINIKKSVLFAVIGVLVLVIIAGGIFFWYKTKAKVISADAAANKAITYITQNFGLSPTLIDSVKEDNAFKVRFTINGTDYTSYVSLDGKYLFPEGYDMNATTTQSQTQQEIVKSDKPDIDLFVMAFCPFGNQAEDTMLPVYNLLKDDANWKIHFIVNVSGNTVSSLHGEPEVLQDEREACVLKNSGLDKWWQFATYVNDNCGSDGSCWQAAAQAAGLSASAIGNCVSSDGLSLMTQEANVTGQAGVGGSPTLIINGVETDAVYQYGDSQAYLEAICSGFNNPPAGCSQQLQTSTNASTGGSCN